MKPAGLTDIDMTYLRGLYRMSPGGSYLLRARLHRLCDEERTGRLLARLLERIAQAAHARQCRRQADGGAQPEGRHVGIDVFRLLRRDA